MSRSAPPSPGPKPFLTARWSNLCIISYLVPRELLLAYMPRGLELDVPPGAPDSMGAISLVAFDFLDTRVKGIRWPRHVNFPEVNLRFYVKKQRDAAPVPSPDGLSHDRGVVFIRELVPRGAISLIARTIYNEPYVRMPMVSHVRHDADRLVVEHRLMPRGARQPSVIRVTAARHAKRPAETTLEHWFKEHQWGFGRSRSGEALVYEVRHPIWDVHEVEQFHLDFDWASIYGSGWGFMANAEPFSVVLAAGSSVEVHPKRNLKGTAGTPATHTPRV